jgi:NADH-quinone oxidoreductase subunit C
LGKKGEGMDREAIEQALIGIEPAARRRENVDRPAIEVPVEKLLGLMRKLRDDERFAFDMMLDHTAIDRLAVKDKLTTNEHELTSIRNNLSVFELVYNLYSTKHGHSLMVICKVPRENPVVPTMEAIWPTAHWQEREVFDLFGVMYDEHTDLRRVFLEDDWKGYPLRKDYKDEDMLEFGE